MILGVESRPSATANGTEYVVAGMILGVESRPSATANGTEYVVAGMILGVESRPSATANGTEYVVAGMILGVECWPSATANGTELLDPMLRQLSLTTRSLWDMKSAFERQRNRNTEIVSRCFIFASS